MARQLHAQNARGWDGSQRDGHQDGFINELDYGNASVKIARTAGEWIRTGSRYTGNLNWSILYIQYIPP